LIFAGEKAWFNRKILASKIAIFIGLISYPLYLWHWVLLSFVRITEMKQPNSWARVSILVVSMILAWLTYYFVEKNIRFQKSKFISIGLLVCLLLIGSAGYIVELQKGYPNRHKMEVNWTEGALGSDIFRKQGLISQKSCLDKYKTLFDKYAVNKEFFDYEFCLFQNSEESPTALLFGDSHANHLYAALITNTNLTGGNLLNLGIGGCYPFVGMSFQEEKCQHLIDNGLKMAIETPSIRTLIMTSRAFKPKDLPMLKKLLSLNNRTQEDFYLTLQNSMRKTLQQLLNANKKIIFVLDTPKLDFSPEECVARPWRLSGQSFKTPCASSRLDIDEARQKYLDIVLPVLKEFTSVKILDPLPAFCDETYCWAIKDKKLLYRDNGHLSKVGAIHLGEYFKNEK
jgi:hypothetical protein